MNFQDFFDASLPPENDTVPTTSEEPKVEPSTSAKSEIPEGFFDDPKQDAKVNKSLDLVKKNN